MDCLMGVWKKSIYFAKKKLKWKVEGDDRRGFGVNQAFMMLPTTLARNGRVWCLIKRILVWKRARYLSERFPCFSVHECSSLWAYKDRWRRSFMLNPWRTLAWANRAILFCQRKTWRRKLVTFYPNHCWVSIHAHAYPGVRWRSIVLQTYT